MFGDCDNYGFSESVMIVDLYKRRIYQLLDIVADDNLLTQTRYCDNTFKKPNLRIYGNYIIDVFGDMLDDSDYKVFPRPDKLLSINSKYKSLINK